VSFAFVENSLFVFDTASITLGLYNWQNLETTPCLILGVRYFGCIHVRMYIQPTTLCFLLLGIDDAVDDPMVHLSLSEDETMSPISSISISEEDEDVLEYPVNDASSE
jgi:hypothetical protein